MGWTFWLRRYGPAEAACLLGMLVASHLAVRVTASPPLLATSAIVGATAGFYGVLVVGVVREQRATVDPDRRMGRVLARTVLLLVAEFGVAEVLDTLMWRPALMMAGVVLVGDVVGPVWGLLAGKVVSDALFYVVSALGYRGTVLAGLRPARRRVISHM